MKDDDATEVNVKSTSNIFQRIRQCFIPIIDFYRPLPSTGAKKNSDDQDFQIDLDFTTTSNSEREIRNLFFQLRFGASLMRAISLFFWAWAVRNTQAMKLGQDLGIYSFFTTFVSSHYLLCRTRSSSGILVATSLTRVLVTASHVLVFMNYCLGVLYSFTVGTSVYYVFGLYCVVFSGLWGYTTFRGFVLLSSLQRHEVEMARGADDEENFEGEDYV